MPRANRNWVAGAAYHITHRCHDRAFLFRAREERDAYRSLLREHLQKLEGVSLLGYTITCNHVHLLLTAEDQARLAVLMQRVQGEYAADYNRRHARSGAFWSDRYHATLIDDGRHLIACLCYIDLNMVRAGVVAHPEAWEWTSWHELIGQRKRYRVIDMPALLNRLPRQNATKFAAYYHATIEEALLSDTARLRDPGWCESAAIGSPSFVDKAESALLADTRRAFTRCQHTSGTWELKEMRPAHAYSPANRASAGL